MDDVATSPLPQRRITVETPEHVAVGYELADLGSRFVALLIDGIILLVAWLAFFVAVPVLIARFVPLPDVLTGFGLGVIVFSSSMLAWLYFVAFEGLRDGQTPGKRIMRIRAVHDGGYPLTLRGSAIRNVLRLLDIQPLPSFAVGGVTMLLHPRTKRLGDIAAETLVVRERAQGEFPEAARRGADAAGRPRLTDAEFAALDAYAARRGSLRPGARAKVAARFVERLGERLDDGADDGAGTTPPTADAVSADERLVRLYDAETARRAVRGTGAAYSAQSVELVRRRRRAWDEYRSLLDRVQRRGLERLPEADVSRFTALYRGLAADLARARTYESSPALRHTLERWVGAGHNALYRPAHRSARRMVAWLRDGFPVLVRMRWRPVAVATIVFVLPALITYSAVRSDPPLASDLLPAQMIERAERSVARQAAGEGYIDVPEVFMPVLAGSVIANNIQVTFMAFAGGLLAGLGTIGILVLNGVFLGAVAGLFAHHGTALQLWSFVLPHGVIELTAVCLAGGAGLWLGSALVLPGRRRRRDALADRAREAVSMLAGTTLLLVIAGVIEGFISPAMIPLPAKLGFAGPVAVLLYAYLAAAGRDDAARRDAASAGTLRRPLREDRAT